MKIDELESNSEQLREILEKPNSAILSWGITVIFCIIIAVFALLWFIKYPDVIEGGIILTTTDPPIKLVNKTDAEIRTIYFDENDNVKKGDVIVELNNPLTGLTKIMLENTIDEIREAIHTENLSSYEVPDNDHNYGVVQQEYSILISSILNYQNLVDPLNIPFKLVNLREQLKNIKLLRQVEVEQIALAEEQLVRTAESFESDKELYDKGVISKTEYFEKENEYVAQQNQVKNLKKAKIQHDIRITELKKEISDTDLDNKQNRKLLKGEINEQLASIEYALDNWKLSNQIIAPFDGKLTYLGNIKENQFIAGGTEVFALVPEMQEYVGLMEIPKTGYGKVKIGQSVRIKLDNFPYYEFGLLSGVVQEVSLVPNQDTYLVKIGLTKGLISSYNKQLTFTPEMSGTSEIITEELRLIDRIFNRIREIFD
ncbi:MAG: multidrug resistance efflux pump [Crocinitomix sp.]|jgi:multidrug resistance efflux pump